MAQFPLHKWELQTDYDATFANGSTLITYWDDVTESVRAYVDDVEVLSGPIISLATSTIVDYKYSFCVGIDLHQFSIEGPGAPFIQFPYSKLDIRENSPACNVLLCDLEIVNYTVTNNTSDDPAAPNGQIEVSATSSRSVQYNIGDFNFVPKVVGDTNEDWPGQLTGIFPNLPPGEYEIYVKDLGGCKQILNLTIITEGVYGLRTVFEYSGLTGENKIEIYELNYEDPPSDNCMTGTDSLIYIPQSERSFYDYTVWPAELTIQALSELTNEFHFLYGRPHKHFRVIKYEAGVEVWRGFILPGLQTEPYRPAPYRSVVRFTDGLVLLKNVPATELSVTGRVNLLDLILLVLRRVDLPGLTFKESIEMYAEGMINTESTLSQVWVDSRTFKRNGNETYYDILEWALKEFGAMLLQREGSWWVVRHDKRGTEFTWQEYDLDGTFLGTGTYQPVRPLNCPGADNRVVAITAPTLEIVPPYGTVEITNELDLKDSLLNNYDFETVLDRDEFGRATEFANWIFRKQLSTKYFIIGRNVGKGDSLLIQQSGDGSSLDPTSRNYYDPEGRTAYIEPDQVWVAMEKDDKLRINFELAFNRIDKAIPFCTIQYEVFLLPQPIGNAWFLQQDGTWEQLAPHVFREYVSPPNGFTTVNFETQEFPETGNFLIGFRLYNYASKVGEFSDTDLGSGGDYDAQWIDHIKAFSTDDKELGYKFDKVYWTGSPAPESTARIFYYELVEQTTKSGVPSLEQIEPDDYDINDNPRNWVLRARLPWRNMVHNTMFALDNIQIDHLPGGVEPIESQTITRQINLDNPEILNTTVHVGSLPLDGAPNDEFNYRNGFGAEIYQPLYFYENWGRKGIAESSRLIENYLGTLITQHRTATQRILGEFSTQNADGSGITLSPLDCIFDTFENIYYIITEYNSLSASRRYELVLTELKAGGTGGEAFRQHNADQHNNSQHA